MVEKHRRVESRNIVGTGMATDAQRIDDLEVERARAERAWRDAPKKGFGEVLDETPAMELDDEDDEDPRRRKRREQDEQARGDDVERARIAASTTIEDAKPKPAPPLKRRPPDPREALMRKALAARGDPPAGTATSPPAGARASTPTPATRPSSQGATPAAPAPMTFDAPAVPPKKGR